MATFKQQTLAVIGAGPKGISVAVKAKVLAEFGFPVDRVLLIEKNSVAANWSGDHGYTNGQLKLGTSPEKDVVFPIETDTGSPELNRLIRRRLMDFTWQAFLIETGEYSDWIDRGRPAPCHKWWAAYLRWVGTQVSANIVHGEVQKVDIDGRTWKLSLDGGRTISADRLMFTGPGKTRITFGNGELPEGTLNLETFWAAVQKPDFSLKGDVAIVGAGENAASVLLELGHFAGMNKVDVISPKGFITTRAENFYENQVYSQPDRNGWKGLELSDRADFIERTDLGVFSAHAMRILNEQERHRIVPGRLSALHRENGKVALTLDYGHEVKVALYDHVILATGFDQIALMKSCLTPAALERMQVMLGAPFTQTELTQRIGPDLSVKGITPTLHLPMLAGLMQGPGFGNLSCLGRLSDRLFLGRAQQAETHITEAVL